MSENNKLRSLQELAQEALDVQDACNLSGVVHSFSRAIIELRFHLADLKAGGLTSTTELNTHPICKLWADKIAHLAGTQFDRDCLTDAYQEVHKLAGVVGVMPSE